MRISDWSSDVCSSDLLQVLQVVVDVFGRSAGFGGRTAVFRDHAFNTCCVRLASGNSVPTGRPAIQPPGPPAPEPEAGARSPVRPRVPRSRPTTCPSHPATACRRPDEHTSEIQSLLRISYAV